MFTTGALGRKQPLEVYGPPGVRNMTEHVLAAWKDDVQGPRVKVHEIASGVVYRDPRITVTVSAGGYRLQTADRAIVIRGDSGPSEAVVKQCNLLILHSLHPDENELNRQMRNLYRGRFIVGHDLDVY